MYYMCEVICGVFVVKTVIVIAVVKYTNWVMCGVFEV